MFTEIMFIFERLWHFFDIWIDAFCVTCHTSCLFKNDSVINSCLFVFSPRKWSMITNSNPRNSHWVKGAFLKLFNNHFPSFFFISTIDFFWSKCTLTRNSTIKCICMCGPITRNISPCLRPSDSFC